MITYHGGPITPDKVAASFWKHRHSLISFAHPDQLPIAASVSESFVLDNGAFSLWKAKKPVAWKNYYEWVGSWRFHPNFDWAIIPDVIDGSEIQNDLLLQEWPFGTNGVPVWHLHESLDRLKRLLSWPRIAFGSSGKWKTPGSRLWWERMETVMDVVCDGGGKPFTKLHGLRMLRRDILERVPFSSADSSTVARNIGLDQNWKGFTQPRNKEVRALCLGANLEQVPHAAIWERTTPVTSEDWLTELIQ